MNAIGNAEPQVSFTKMDDATPEELSLIVTLSKKHLNDKLVDTMIDLLNQLKGPTLGYRVDRYEHSLQTATRASLEGARPDMVVAALLHDVGDAMAPANHAELAASILRPYVDEETAWVVEHHGLFQGYHYFDKIGLDRNARERHRKNPYFDTTAHFCGSWDQVSFDPDYPTMALDSFLPVLREVFSRPATGYRTD